MHALFIMILVYSFCLHIAPDVLSHLSHLPGLPDLTFLTNSLNFMERNVFVFITVIIVSNVGIIMMLK